MDFWVWVHHGAHPNWPDRHAPFPGCPLSIAHGADRACCREGAARVPSALSEVHTLPATCGASIFQGTTDKGVSWHYETPVDLITGTGLVRSRQQPVPSDALLALARVRLRLHHDISERTRDVRAVAPADSR